MVGPPRPDPFAPPEADLGEPGADARDDAHEASLQRLASWMLLIGSASAVYAANGVRVLWVGGLDRERIALVGATIGLAFAQLTGARGLRRLDPDARLGASVATVLMLPWLPVGTYLGFRGLYALWSRRGRNVLSPRYAAQAAAQGWAPRPLRAWVPLATPWALYVILLGFRRALA
jgi:hypothetical protein